MGPIGVLTSEGRRNADLLRQPGRFLSLPQRINAYLTRLNTRQTVLDQQWVKPGFAIILT